MEPALAPPHLCHCSYDMTQEDRERASHHWKRGLFGDVHLVLRCLWVSLSAGQLWPQSILLQKQGSGIPSWPLQVEGRLVAEGRKGSCAIAGYPHQHSDQGSPCTTAGS